MEVGGQLYASAACFDEKNLCSCQESNTNSSAAQPVARRYEGFEDNIWTQKGRK
jgi:hypothetical protein